MEVRFLTGEEYGQTKALAAVCFGEDGLEEYYCTRVPACRIAAAVENGTVCAMVHLHRMLVTADTTFPALYLSHICTAPAYRRQGLMDAVTGFVLQTLRKEGERFVFLVPVDTELYVHLGFVHFWQFGEAQRDLLLADDGLTRAAGMMLRGTFAAPTAIAPAAGLSDLSFVPFDAEQAAAHFDFFHIRPNRTCDSLPMECVSYSAVSDSRICMADDRCLLMVDHTEEAPMGCIPFCKEAELPGYFKLQERYFNQVLHAPFRSYWADGAGVEVLKRAGLLDGYTVTENPEIYDYIYLAEELRQLPGRKFAKKRNRIRKFLREYENRWEYRTLGYEDRRQIIGFLEQWNRYRQGTEEASLAETVDAAETLEIDISGAERILCCEALMAHLRAGGIFVDGRLCAFTMGGYNPTEDMAIISVEKALPDMEGLYQLINREFLRHAFPQAKYVNREDDVGLPGLRKAKQSYYPVAFAHRYTLEQNMTVKTADTRV